MQEKGFKKYFFPILYLKLDQLSVGLRSDFFHYLLFNWALQWIGHSESLKQQDFLSHPKRLTNYSKHTVSLT
jgi:hypothetical protein